jgi:hypothetical protein
VEPPHLIHQFEVLVSLEPRRPHAHVVGLLPKLLVVGSDVQQNREHAVGRDAAGGDVQGKLADGDAHVVRAEVAQAGGLGRGDERDG